MPLDYNEDQNSKVSTLEDFILVEKGRIKRKERSDRARESYSVQTVRFRGAGKNERHAGTGEEKRIA
ncbi:MAG: hypothetical protein NVSMB9_14310 [Isosphaeraceae bacterium]